MRFVIIATLTIVIVGILTLAANHAYGQISDQDTANLNELAHYNDVLTAFTNACTNAINNHDSATMTICTQIFNEEHDILKPFMDMNKDAIAKVIVGP